MKKLVIAVIRGYKKFLSPLFPSACRFTPTCSEYAMEAFEKKRFHQALWMTIVRIAKCNPFHPGGYDPVQ